MPELDIAAFRRIEARFERRDWAFARERAGEIAAHWRELMAGQSALFNGKVLLQFDRHVESDVLHARYFETDFASFLACRDFGWPDPTVRNGFAMAALRAADGAFILGEMAKHTANAGKIYFPAGTPDLSDVTADGGVDLLASVTRELEEETGLTPSEVAVGVGWTAVTEAHRMAFMRPVSIDLPAEAARDLILARLSRQPQPELSHIRIVRSPSDIDPAVMPAFVGAYLRHAFSG